MLHLKVRFKPFQGVLISAILGTFFQKYLMVNSVKGLLQINKDYTVKKTSVNIDTPVIVCLQQGSKSAV